MRSISLLFAAATLVASSEIARSDPYAKEIEEQKGQEFVADLNSLRDGVTRAYFALGCRVFANEGAISAMVYHYRVDAYQRQLYRVQNNRSPYLSDIYLDEEKRAKQAGLAKARNSCDYWHNNADEVLQIRQEAKDAVFRESSVPPPNF